jgi:sulfur-oxidizing protein SoxZ
MAAVKPRIKLDKKEAKKGELVEVKALVQHVMETGNRRDANGTIVPRKILNKFVCTVAGKQVFAADFETAISANPYIQFKFKAEESGPVVLTWTDDDGSTITGEESITVVLLHGHSGARRRREPGIQYRAPGSRVDSGFRPSAGPGLTAVIESDINQDSARDLQARIAPSRSRYGDAHARRMEPRFRAAAPDAGRSSALRAAWQRHARPSRRSARPAQARAVPRAVGQYRCRRSARKGAASHRPRFPRPL